MEKQEKKTQVAKKLIKQYMTKLIRDGKDEIVNGKKHKVDILDIEAVKAETKLSISSIIDDSNNKKQISGKVREEINAILELYDKIFTEVYNEVYEAYLKDSHKKEDKSVEVQRDIDNTPISRLAQKYNGLTKTKDVEKAKKQLEYIPIYKGEFNVDLTKTSGKIDKSSEEREIGG